MVTGKVQDLGNVILSGVSFEGRTKFTRLPLWDAPVLIIDRDEIAWDKK